MTTLDNLHPASFKSIPFLIPSENLVRGHKTAVHEFLNSDERYIEELGKLPSVYNLTCIVHGNDSLNNRFRLENALDDGGFGELVHPIYGALQVKVMGEYSITSNQRRVGEHTFTVTFGLSKDNIAPAVKSISNAEVTTEAFKNFDALNLALSDIYKVPSTGYNSHQAGETSYNRIEKILLQLDIISEDLGIDIRATYRAFSIIQQKIYSLVDKPQELADAFRDIYIKFRSLANTPDELYHSFRALVSTIPSPLVPSTSVRAENKNNVDSINEYNDLAALNFLYEAAVYKEFKTDIDLGEAQQDLTLLFYFFFQDTVDTSDQVLTLTQELPVRDAFSTFHNLFLRKFDEKEQLVWKTKEVDGDSTTLLTAYDYFGNIDNLELIKELNPGINFAGFKDKVIMISK